MQSSYKVPYGKGSLSFDVPDNWLVDVAESTTETQPLSTDDINQQLLAFAEHLKTSHDPAKKLIFVFTDATRASPDQTLLEPIVRHLADEDFDIHFLCAVGMHRPSTQQEKVYKLGHWIVEHFSIHDHNPEDVKNVGDVNGIPVDVNPMLLDATVVGVGVVEPHQYAGYSGGAKTIVIGCGGRRTIGATHDTQFLDDDGTRLGAIENNPFQSFIRQAGELIGQQYAVNVLLNDSYEILDLVAGRPNDVHDTLVAKGRELYEVRVPNAPYDAVIAGVGYPKDVNLYQASRGATYIGLSSNPVVRKASIIIVPAPIPEGGGEGKGEQNFMQMMLRFGPTIEMIEHLRQAGCRPGDQRAFMVAQLRQQYRLIIAMPQKTIPVVEADLDIAHSMDEALYMAARLSRQENPRLLIVPHALQTIPVP